MEYAIQLKNVTKTFGKVVANKNVNLNVRKGEILSLLGENGSGKTTLMNMISGIYFPDSGEILVDGKHVEIRSPKDAYDLGIGMIHQHFKLIDVFSATENIALGLDKKQKFDLKEVRKKAQAICDRYHFDLDLNQKVYEMSVSQKQTLEIVKVLYRGANILILDEPTAVLTPQETARLFEVIRNMKADNKSVIIITHKLQEVMDVADRAVIMRKGRYVGERRIEDTTIKELSYLMVGRGIPPREIEERKPGKAVLEVENLTFSKDGVSVLKGVNLCVREGEIVGLAGVSGNGQTELIQCLTGLAHPDGGSIRLNGQEIFHMGVRKIREAGCAHIPEDRYAYGCAVKASLEETSIMGYEHQEGFSSRGILNTNHNRQFTKNLLEKYDVKYDRIADQAGALSGGNIQKLIVAREIEHHSKFLIAAEPTRGVDIGAQEFIHDQLVEKRRKDGAILLVSSELSEILSLSDRVYVIYDGLIRGEFERKEFSTEKVGYLMMGGRNE